MFIRKPAHQDALDDAIESALNELAGHDAASDGYSKIVEQVTALNEIRDKKTDRVSKDTLAIVLGNLAGILVIVGYESKHVVASKALGFVGKFK